MNEFELFKDDGSATWIWACGECSLMHLTRHGAETCCLCKDCKAEKCEQHRTVCSACSEKRDEQRRKGGAEKYAADMAAAEVVENDFGFWYGDKWCKDFEDMECELDCGDEVPEFCFSGSPVRFRKWDVDDVMQNEDENYGCEDDCITFKGVDELRQAFEAFNDDNDGRIMCYGLDRKKKVRTKS